MRRWRVVFNKEFDFLEIKGYDFYQLLLLLCNDFQKTIFEDAIKLLIETKNPEAKVTSPQVLFPRDFTQKNHYGEHFAFEELT